MIKNWMCSQCKSKILGKIHPISLLIIQHKGLRISISGDFSLSANCPKCGADNCFSQSKTDIETLLGEDNGEKETSPESGVSG